MTDSQTAIPGGARLDPAAATVPVPVPSLSLETLAEAIGARLPENRGAVERLRAVAGQAVEDYAPSAPPVLKAEAVIRFAGYLFGSDFGGITSEDIGPRTVAYTVNHADAFRRSGAAMLLTRYRLRRAGLAG